MLLLYRSLFLSLSIFLSLYFIHLSYYLISEVHKKRILNWCVGQQFELIESNPPQESDEEEGINFILLLYIFDLL